MAQNNLTFNAKDLFGNFPQYNKWQDDYENGFEIYWKWPQEIGNGFMYMIKLRPGLVLGIGDFQLIKNIAVNFECEFFPIIFAYGIRGVMRYTSDPEERVKELYSFRQGHTTIAYSQEWQGVARPPSGVPVNWLSICTTPQLLNTLIGNQYDLIPDEIYNVEDVNNEKQYYQVSDTVHSSYLAIKQIFDCQYQGQLKRLYLESKVLELITHSLAQFVPEPAPKKTLEFRPQDIERVQYARELLKLDLQNPPKLLELAKTVGLPHPKLNFCFREVYGTTVFGYLRQARLNKAKLLLDDGKMNVTEAAYEVGYSSLSHFAKSFKDHYGVAPSTYLRAVSHRSILIKI